ncbi:hypothetical protein ABZR86_17640 [Dyella marensis]|uniref:Sel1 repeat family protein n=1 Tax=Dyella marensis TaxID=500610 RepID=A0A1I2IYP8_9GAMM|nr:MULTISPECIES: hypothetical protein [Dyella]SFF47652.1 hypothetical protein SAMN02799615_03740 [Dyella marensis]
MKRNHLVILSVGPLAVATAAWAIWHSADSNGRDHKPVATMPTAEVESAAGDAPEAPRARLESSLGQAASGKQLTAQFEQSRRCYFSHGQANARKSVAKACQEIAKGGQAKAQADSCMANIAADEDEAARSNQQDAADCPGDVASAKHFYEMTKAAASSGNADAQACYVQSVFQNNGVALTYSQQDIADYRRDAPRYISDGLARGDWRIVSMLARGGHGDNDGLLPLVTKNDVYAQYVMNRLLQQGAEGPYALELERSIRMSYLSPGITTPPPLTQQQVADGTREAQGLYRKSFDKQPKLQAAPIACRGI